MGTHNFTMGLVVTILFLSTRAYAQPNFWPNAPQGLLSTPLSDCKVTDAQWTSHDGYTFMPGARITQGANDSSSIADLNSFTFILDGSAIPGGYGVINPGDEKGTRVWFYSEFTVESENASDNVEYTLKTRVEHTPEGGQGMMEFWFDDSKENLFIRTSVHQADEEVKFFEISCSVISRR